MRFSMKSLLNICISFFLYFSAIFSQNSVPDIYKTYPTFTGNTYNETGMKSKGSLFIDGNESINNFNGNLALSFATTLNLPNNIGGEITLSYNPNVGHKYFKQDAIGASYINPSGYSFNFPSWIIGFKDIAIQTLNFNNDMYGDYFIQGYNYNNSIGTRVNEEYRKFGEFIMADCNSSVNWPAQENDHKDMINILKSDGSMLTLYSEIGLQGLHVKRTGVFSAYGTSSNGKAEVNYLESQPQFTAGLRKLIYYSGNGLTYEFTEKYARYLGRDIFDLSYEYKIPTSGGTFSEFWLYNNLNTFYWCSTLRQPYTGYLERRCSREPKIFYLTKITTQYGDELTFEYDDTVMNGRQNLKCIYYNKFSTPDKKIFEIDYNINSNQIVLKNLMTGENIFTNIVKDGTQDFYKVSSIKNNLNLETSFGYAQNFKRWWEATARMDDVVGRVDIFGHTNIPLINTIDYYNGKRIEYSYYNAPFIGGSYDTYYNGTEYYYDTEWSPEDFYFYSEQPRNGASKENMLTTFRDNYTTYMVKKRKVFENINSPILEQEYFYTYEDPLKPTDYDPFDPEAYNIRTKIITSNLISSDPSINSNTKTEIFEYASFAIGEKPVSATMNIPSYGKVPYGRILKLMNEKVYENENSVIEKKYEYNLGMKNFDGSSEPKLRYANNKWYYIILNGTAGGYSTEFELRKKTEFLNSVLKNETNYDYEYDFNIINSSPAYNACTFAKTLFREIDATDFCNQKSFQPAYIDDDFNKPFIYEQLLSEKEYNTTNSNLYKKHIEYYYYPYNVDGKKFKLEKIMDSGNGMTRKRSVKYNYYTDTNHKGFLQKESFFKNTNSTPELEYEYFYNDQLSYNAQGYIVNKDGGKSSLLNINHAIYQHLPFKLKTIVNSQTISEVYSAFNQFGNPVFLIDANKYYFSYDYDLIGRIKNYYVPGSYWFSGTTYGTQTPYVSIVYDDINNKKIVSECYDFKASPVKLKTYQEEYTGLGKLKKLSLKNDSGIFETKKELWYNYYDLVSKEKDGMNIYTYYKYDYFTRPIETKYMDNSKKSISYLGVPIGGGEYFNNFDEENNKTQTCYNSDGTLKYNISYNYEGSNLVPYTTNFYYNNLKQQISVSSPKGLTTSYAYDDEFGKISQKSNSDQGTEKYKYDVFGNLRFIYHTTAQPSLLIYSSYDKLNRPLTTGEKSSNITEFNSLNPDVSTDFDNNSTYLTTVNMYDSYNPIGVFSTMSFPYSSSLGNLNGRLVGTAFRDKPGDPWNYKLYSYDYLGRIKYDFVKLPNGQWKQIVHLYDNSGNETYLYAQDGPVIRYYYDSQLRLKSLNATLYNKPDQNIVNYSYNLSNQVSEINYKGVKGQVSNALLYSYNSTRGWLTTIDEALNMAFNEMLTYKLNGNVNSLSIKNYVSNWQTLQFNYSYDNLNRISNVTCNQNSAYNESLTYDRDGNLTSKIGNNKHLVYYYASNSNRVTDIEDFGPLGKYFYIFHDAKGNISYKEEMNFGNILSFGNFNKQNLPLNVSVDGTTNYYKYDDKGNRILKKVGTGSVTNDYYLRDYLGRELNIYNLNDGNLKMSNIFGGGLVASVNANWVNQNEESLTRSDELFYYIKDHLGNIRQVIDQDGNIVSANDYYSFGEILRSFNTGSFDGRYKITEKERDDETSLDYFGARYYDSELGRWLQVDPLADKYPGWSPYNYTMNNPLNYIDYLGLWPGDPPTKTTQIVHTFVFDKTNTGAKMDSGTDIFTETVRYNSGSSITQRITRISVDSKGNISENATVIGTAEANSGDNFQFGMTDPQTVSSSTVSNDLMTAAQKESKYKNENAQSSLQTQADNINLGLAVGVSIISAVGSGGTSVIYQASTKTAIKMGVAGSVIGTLATPSISAENLRQTQTKKEEITQ